MNRRRGMCMCMYINILYTYHTCIYVTPLSFKINRLHPNLLLLICLFYVSESSVCWVSISSCFNFSLWFLLFGVSIDVVLFDFCLLFHFLESSLAILLPNVCMHVCKYVPTYVRTYACTYACTYVRRHICMSALA